MTTKQIIKNFILYFVLILFVNVIYPFLYHQNIDLTDLFNSIITVTVFFITYVQNQKQHQLTQSQSEKQYLSTQQTIAENSRISLLPFLHFTKGHDNEYPRKRTANLFIGDANNKSKNVKVLFTNVGLATAVDVSIFDSLSNEKTYYGNIAKGEEINLTIFYPDSIETNIIVQFTDLSGRKYLQHGKISFLNEFDVSVEYPVFDD